MGRSFVLRVEDIITYHLITHYNTNILMNVTGSLVIYYDNFNITDTSTSFIIKTY